MRKVKSLLALGVTLILIIVLHQTIEGQLVSENNSSSETVTSKIDEIIFPHDSVVDVNIEIDPTVYEEFIANAQNEEIVSADITYNGYTFQDVGIRAKGNSSLNMVAKSESPSRYSFKVDFNYYLNDQSFFGITKLNLNNLISDPTLISEYLCYEMLESIGTEAPRTTYVALSINGEYFGLYLSVEHINEAFLLEHYGNATGELYKPDMGVGSDLVYISDEPDDYTGLTDENNTNTDNSEITELINVINNGGDIESIFNVDSFLKYLAFSTIVINADSYQGGMFHNYYLYNNKGVFEWIGWDYNMIFQSFNGTSSDSSEVYIDEPYSGEAENHPLVSAILANDEYKEKYHEYLLQLINGYLATENLNQQVTSAYEMIKTYAQTDPTAFTDYATFESYVTGDNYKVSTYYASRCEDVLSQLSGDTPSTNNGEGSSGIQMMGGGGGAKGGMNGTGGAPMQRAQNNTAETNSTSIESEPTITKPQPGLNTDNAEDQDPSASSDSRPTPPEGQMLPEGEMPYGELPNSQMLYGEFPNGQMPYGDFPNRQMPDGNQGNGKIGGMNSEAPDETEATSTPLSWASLAGIGVFAILALGFMKYLSTKDH